MCHCRVSAGCHDCRSRADYALTPLLDALNMFRGDNNVKKLIIVFSLLICKIRCKIQPLTYLQNADFFTAIISFCIIFSRHIAPGLQKQLLAGQGAGPGRPGGRVYSLKLPPGPVDSERIVTCKARPLAGTSSSLRVDSDSQGRLTSRL